MRPPQFWLISFFFFLVFLSLQTTSLLLAQYITAMAQNVCRFSRCQIVVASTRGGSGLGKLIDRRHSIARLFLL